MRRPHGAISLLLHMRLQEEEGRLWVRRMGSPDKLFLFDYHILVVYNIHDLWWLVMTVQSPRSATYSQAGYHLMVFCTSVVVIVNGSDKVGRICGHESSQCTVCYYKWETENAHHSVFLISWAQPQDLTDTKELYFSVLHKSPELTSLLRNTWIYLKCKHFTDPVLAALYTNDTSLKKKKNHLSDSVSFPLHTVIPCWSLGIYISEAFRKQH